MPGKGRPTIGPECKVRLTEEILDEVAAFAEAEGFTSKHGRGQALRELILRGLAASDTNPKQAPENTTPHHDMVDVFPEFDDHDATTIDWYDICRDEANDDWFYAELGETYGADTDLTVMTIRGHYVVFVGERLNGKFQQQLREVVKGKKAGLDTTHRYIIELTNQYWDPTIYAKTGRPLWEEHEFALNYQPETFPALVETTQIPHESVYVK